MNTERGWRPIETAPKDGTKILAFGRGVDRPFYDTESGPMPFQIDVVSWYQYEDEDFVLQGDGSYKKERKVFLAQWRPQGISWFKPSHWQPLPEPPIDGTKKDSAPALESSTNNEVTNT